MGTRRPGNTAGRHLEQHHPLPKGQACSTCKSRKVRCSGSTPACQACMRTARFEGRDPALVQCQYGGLKCGVKGGKGKSLPPEPTQEEQETARLEREMVEFERIVRANLKALPPSRSSSTSSTFSAASAPSSEPRHVSESASASTSSNFASQTWSPMDTSPYASTSYFPSQIPYLAHLASPLVWDAPSAASSSSSLSHYAMPASPDSFHSSSSYDSVYTPSSPLFEMDSPPEHFLSSEHTEDTLSLPFFPLPPQGQTYGGGAPVQEDWGEHYWVDSSNLWAATA